MQVARTWPRDEEALALALVARRGSSLVAGASARAQRRAAPRARRALRRAGLRDVGAAASPAASTSSSRPGGSSCSTSGKIRATPFLDIRSLVLSGGEQGLLSVAFDPDYATEPPLLRRLHRPERRHARRASTARTARRAIPSSAKQLLFVKDFASNHNGGQLQFGPDGRLYWGNGDGGGGGDPQHNGQSLARPFAKIMRLNVNAAKPRWQLVAYGLRNPWRFSFDRATGDLYIGDVGQGAWEEIDYLQARHAGDRELRLEPLRGHARLRRVDAAADARRLPRAGRRVLALATAARSPAATSTAARRCRRPSGATSTATTARARSGACKIVGRQGDAACAASRSRSTGLSSFGEDAAGELYLMSVDSGDLFRLAG